VEKVPVSLTVPVALLSPPVLLAPPFPGAVPSVSWAVKPWNSLPREVVDAPYLSVFQRHLDNTLNML